MSRAICLRILCLVSLTLASCGSVSVASKPSQKISRSAKITVVSPNSDPQNIAGQLEHLLLSQGFEVTSEAVGSKQIEYTEGELSQPGSRITSGVVSAVNRLPTELIHGAGPPRVVLQAHAAALALVSGLCLG